jgi:hypothetical protein
MIKAKRHAMKPVIINPESNFVVVTYWWGRGNSNRNFQRPCPATLKDDQKLTKQPINYEDMISKLFEKSCASAKCNYMAIEYPEFAVKGGYQAAINYKPEFIEKALKACYPRGVLYIDGDMLVKKYPNIFDTPNVDFMARGWSADVRDDNKVKPPHVNRDHLCFDPYLFETSGGTMFFGNTRTAHKLLQLWRKISAKHPGKADDRILSMIINQYRLVERINMISLPIEYLWLTLSYEPSEFEEFGKVDKKSFDHSQIMIEHPECLTAEEVASDLGAAGNRIPDNYVELVEDMVKCGKKTMHSYFYPFVFFTDKKYVKAFDFYLDWMNKYKIMTVVPYEETYGKYKEIAAKNVEKSKQVLPKVTRNSVVVSSKEIDLPNVHVAKTSVVPTILYYLTHGQDVYYLPEKGNAKSLEAVKKNARDSEIELVCKNKRMVPYEYKLDLDLDYPMYFSSKNIIIKHLLLMSKSLSSLSSVFNSSYGFVSRIRIDYVGTRKPRVKRSPKRPQSPKLKPATPPKPAPLTSKPASPSGHIFPKIVHQIWFGAKIDAWRQKMMEKVKRSAQKAGYKYRLWTNEDRTAENFPSTFKLQNEAIEFGQKTKQNRLAQVADLARIEIITRNGGIYLDSLFEVSPDLFKTISKAFENKDVEFVGANEDPCGLKCADGRGNHYISNSFFAGRKDNSLLKKLLSKSSIDSIDLHEKKINRTTGPYFLRKAISTHVDGNGQVKGVQLLDTMDIYPFPMSGSEQRPFIENHCLSKTVKKGWIEVRKDMYLNPNCMTTFKRKGAHKPLAIYQVGLGGTWDWQK